MAFVDSNGLLYFWQKIKSFFQQKLTAGSNIQINGTTISATDTTYGPATHDSPGLMSAVDKTNLDANTSARHSHSNKSVLDGITSEKVSSWDSKQGALTFDDTPTAGSNNPVKSGGILQAINDAVKNAADDVSGLIPEGSNTSDGTPNMDGTASRGTSNRWARADHVHPKDTSKANLASPTFTGTPKAPTATAGTNTTQIATTAFVTQAIAAAKAGASVFKGVVLNNTTISTLTAYDAGWYWVVGAAGTYVGQVCEPGDFIFCVEDYAGGYSADDFRVVQNNLVAITNAEIDTILAS